jgi:antitoxin ParD1/3/4
MNVNLGTTLERFVADLLESGEYQSQSEVIREGLRMLKEREDFKQLRIEQLRQEIQAGNESGPSKPLDFERIKTEGRRQLGNRRRNKK